MTVRKAAVLLALAAASLPAPAATPPSRMMANVYLLAQAGAVLDVCLASPDAPSFPAAKAEELAGLAARLGGVVRSIAAHYRDEALASTYEATKAKMASEPALRLHVKNNHRNCGDRLVGEMRAYVAENEALIGKFVAPPSVDAPPKKKAAQP